MEDEMDILLVSCGDSEAATLWVNYLISCFQQISKDRNKPPFKYASESVVFLVFEFENNRHSINVTFER